MNTGSKKQKKNGFKVVLILLACMGILLGLRFMTIYTADAEGDRAWSVRISVTAVADAPGALLAIQPPYETPHARVIQRDIQHKDLQMQNVRSKEQGRYITTVTRGPGQYTLSVNFIMQTSLTPRYYVQSTKQLTELQRERFLQEEDILQMDHQALDLLAWQLGLQESDKDDIPKIIHDHLFNLGTYPGVPMHTPLERALDTGRLNSRLKALVMVSLLRKSHIPARLVTGLMLKEDLEASVSWWVEAYVDDSWSPYHPELGYEAELPYNLVAFDKTGKGLSMVQDARQISREIEIEQLPVSYISKDATRSNWFYIFDLNRLPVEVREQLALLMLLPVAALVAALVRHFAGIHSYGVFTPVMLALAMVYTDYITTTMILLVTVIGVYFGRPAFHSSVSRTPRLSIIFTFVAVSMGLGVSLLDYMQWSTSGHLVLLPIVILTSLVDRYFGIVEKRGFIIASIRLGWTAVIAFLVLPILQFEWLGYLFLAFPELHLLTAALLLSLSAYKGKQLIDLPGFRFLAEPPAPVPASAGTKKPAKQVEEADGAP